MVVRVYIFVFFFNDTATTEIYTLPYTTLFRSEEHTSELQSHDNLVFCLEFRREIFRSDRKSTRLNSSHTIISYAVFFVNKRRSLNSSDTQTSYAALRGTKTRIRCHP